ncbi:hypothetical protein HYPGJ_10173 [Hyphomicrobium sp. GJ21]|nr:hypothetical protein HYPGJ_10173 [Hyphomicrobium sp. GJ21]
MSIRVQIGTRLDSLFPHLASAKAESAVVDIRLERRGRTHETHYCCHQTVQARGGPFGINGPGVARHDGH